MSVPRLGDRDRQIVIQRDQGATQSATGQPVTNWQTLYTLWAAVQPVYGMEAYRSQRVTASQVRVFTTEYVAGITAKDRISYESKYWNITNIAELGRQEGLEITAEVVE